MKLWPGKWKKPPGPAPTELDFVADLRPHLWSRINQVEARMAALDDLIAQFNAAMTGITAKITLLTAQTTQLQAQVIQLQATITQLQTQLAAGDTAALSALQPLADQLTSLSGVNVATIAVVPAPAGPVVAPEESTPSTE